MNRRPGSRAPALYEIRLVGHLDEHWSTWFDGLTIINEDDDTTTLRGAVTDQAELHGLLAKVRDLGLTLISVRPGEADHRGRAVAQVVQLASQYDPQPPFDAGSPNTALPRSAN